MATKKIVFFGCSMRGGHKVVSQDHLAMLAIIIEELGCELASKHQTQKGIIESEDKLTPSKIHDRDFLWQKASNAGVFEISNPSLGVGAEIVDMLHEKKPVLCLFTGDKKAVSAYIRGMQGSKFVTSHFECHYYSSLDEARDIITQFIKCL